MPDNRRIALTPEMIDAGSEALWPGSLEVPDLDDGLPDWEGQAREVFIAMAEAAGLTVDEPDEGPSEWQRPVNLGEYVFMDTALKLRLEKALFGLPASKINACISAVEEFIEDLKEEATA